MFLVLYALYVRGLGTTALVRSRVGKAESVVVENLPFVVRKGA